jgi:predicted transcriptional regulator
VKNRLKKYAYILVNYEKYWKILCSQNRACKANHSFVRRGTTGPKNANKLFFYVTHPRQDIQGYADFVERKTDDAKDLWESLGPESLLNSYGNYQKFLDGRRKSTFIRFKNLKEFPKPVSTEVWKQIIGKDRMPQNGLYITEKMARQLLSAGGVEN